MYPPWQFLMFHKDTEPLRLSGQVAEKQCHDTLRRGVFFGVLVIFSVLCLQGVQA
jgi:hypothetical protein